MGPARMRRPGNRRRSTPTSGTSPTPGGLTLRLSSGGKRITYQTLLRFSDSLCMNLTTRVPVTGGERRLAVLTGNTPPSVMALLAASRSGTQVEFIDPTLPADIIRKRLDLTGGPQLCLLMRRTSTG
ncbi:hypothetical protein [Thermogymnomonas acidicola]|uniref:hypothetical protein n=1 Tax=Thermogymnomonas acidicola TaxID=399579 RepID=UPI001396C626|nr:hypothetical protein [Thermogymnomonas acidicola]